LSRLLDLSRQHSYLPCLLLLLLGQPVLCSLLLPLSLRQCLLQLCLALLSIVQLLPQSLRLLPGSSCSRLSSLHAVHVLCRCRLRRLRPRLGLLRLQVSRHNNKLGLVIS